LHHAFSENKYISLIKIFFSYLSKDSINSFIKNGIDIDLSYMSKKPPLFNYISFLKSIIIFDISKVIEVYYSTKFSEKQKNIIEKEFYNIVFNQCSTIKCL